MTKTLTAERLRELLHYDPQTGVFYWRVDRRKVRAGDVAGQIATTVHGYQYRRITIDGKQYFAHRLAFLWMTGEWPPSLVDHEDCDGLNNCWGNIRVADFSTNGGNRRAQRNINGCKGVTESRSRCSDRVRYEARIGVRGKRIHLGTYDTPEEAHAAYVAAAQKHFGEYARSA